MLVLRIAPFGIILSALLIAGLAASFGGSIPRQPPSPRNDKPLVGICLVGGLRTFWRARESMWRNLFESLQPDPAYRVLISQVNDDSSQCRANPMTCPKCPYWCQQNANKSMAVMGELIQASEQFHLNEEINCNHPRVRDQHLCVAWPHAHERPNNERRGGSWSFGQYMNRHVCLQRLIEYERVTGKRFDVVTLVRPDMYFFDVVPNAEYFMRMRPRIIFGSKEGGQPPADYLYIVPRSMLEELMDLLWRAYSESFERRRLYSAPEERIQGILDDWKTPYQVFPVHFGVLRHTTVVECWRMDNPYMNHHYRLRSANHTSTPASSSVTAAVDHERVRGLVDDCKALFPGEPGDR